MITVFLWNAGCVMIQLVRLAIEVLVSCGDSGVSSLPFRLVIGTRVVSRRRGIVKQLRAQMMETVGHKIP